jgi:hypothetical protein
MLVITKQVSKRMQNWDKSFELKSHTGCLEKVSFSGHTVEELKEGNSMKEDAY